MAPQTDRSTALALPSVVRTRLPKARVRLTVLQDRSAALSGAELRVVSVRPRERTRVQVGVRVKRFKGATGNPELWWTFRVRSRP